MIDVAARLEVQMLALKLCIANGIQTYHQQMSAILQEPVKLSQMAPLLVSIDRARMATNLGIGVQQAVDASKEEAIMQKLPSSNKKKDNGINEFIEEGSTQSTSTANKK